MTKTELDLHSWAASWYIELYDLEVHSDKTYYIVTNADDNFKYQDGLNVAPDNIFNFNDLEHTYFYSDDAKCILEIKLPVDDPNFIVCKERLYRPLYCCCPPWKANMIILKNRYDLFDVNTFKMLAQKGFAFIDNYDAIQYAIKHNLIDHINWMIDIGVDINITSDMNKFCNVLKEFRNKKQIETALDVAVRFNYIDTVRVLIKNNINAELYQKAIKTALEYGNHDIVQLLEYHNSEPMFYYDLWYY